MNDDQPDPRDLDLDTRPGRHELARRMSASLRHAQCSVNHPALHDLAEYIAILSHVKRDQP